MRYSIAIWNFGEEGVALVRLADESAGSGSDAVSLLPGQRFGGSRRPDAEREGEAPAEA